MLTWYDFLPDIVGSLIGVLLGFIFGICLERRTRLEESKEKKQRYLDAILYEVNYNKEILDKSKPIWMKLDDKKDVSYYPEHMSTESLVSGIYSGEFQSLSINIQTKLTKYLLYCRYINSIIDTLNFRSPSTVQGFNLSNQSSHYYDTLKKYIPELIKDLK